MKNFYYNLSDFNLLRSLYYEDNNGNTYQDVENSNEKVTEYKQTNDEIDDIKKIHNHLWLNLEKRNSNIHGKGLFANDEIGVNNFIIKYTGKVVKNESKEK